MSAATYWDEPMSENENTESAKAIAEVAKATGKAIDAGVGVSTLF